MTTSLHEFLQKLVRELVTKVEELSNLIPEVLVTVPARRCEYRKRKTIIQGHERLSTVSQHTPIRIHNTQRYCMVCQDVRPSSMCFKCKVIVCQTPYKTIPTENEVKETCWYILHHTPESGFPPAKKRKIDSRVVVMVMMMVIVMVMMMM